MLVVWGYTGGSQRPLLHDTNHAHRARHGVGSSSLHGVGDSGVILGRRNSNTWLDVSKFRAWDTSQWFYHMGFFMIVFHEGLKLLIKNLPAFRYKAKTLKDWEPREKKEDVAWKKSSNDHTPSLVFFIWFFQAPKYAWPDNKRCTRGGDQTFPYNLPTFLYPRPRHW